MSNDIRIGISGWRYEPWRGDFMYLRLHGELNQANHLAIKPGQLPESFL